MTAAKTIAIPVTMIVFDAVRCPTTAVTKPTNASAMNGPGAGSKLNSLPRKFSASTVMTADKVAQVSFSR